MDTPTTAALSFPNVGVFSRLSPRTRALLMLGAAGLIAVVAAAWLWSTSPNYGILFTNVSDRDGGAILAQLTQMNIPYKNADGGTILVPADKVHEARLKLAELPRNGAAIRVRNRCEVTGRPRGFAFVELTEPQMVRSAIDELHGADFGGRTIVVNEAREPQRRGFDRDGRSAAVIDRPGQGYAAPRQAQRRSGGYGQRACVHIRHTHGRTDGRTSKGTAWIDVYIYI